MTFKFSKEEEEAFLKALDQVPLGRSSTQIHAFVLDVKGPPEAKQRRYRQCLLEMDGKYRALHTARIAHGRHKLKVRRLEWWKRFAFLPSWKQRIDLMLEEEEFGSKMQQNLVKDAMIELATFWYYLKELGDITREEFEKAEPAYWQKRLENQARNALIGDGRMGEGNTEALQQIGLDPYDTLADLKLQVEQGMSRAIASAPERMKISERTLPTE